MLNVYCVWVKPKYCLKNVEDLYIQCSKYLSVKFNMICLTDQDATSKLPIRFINIDDYGLDTWWNKVLIFDRTICGTCTNIYFDLDVKILSNIDCLVNQAFEDNLFVVDTPWKGGDYLHNYYVVSTSYKRLSAFLSYGNSSVMGWTGNSHQFLPDILLKDIFKHTTEHFGDDTFINKYGKIKYFPPIISRSYDVADVVDPKILINYKFNTL